MTSKELACEAVRVLDKKKAADIKMVGIKDISVLTDYFVIATGTSSTHVKSLADEVEFALKQEGIKPAHTEGYRSNSWVLLDYGGVIVHIFTEDARAFYDLDHLWRDGEAIDIGNLLTSE